MSRWCECFSLSQSSFPVRGFCEAPVLAGNHQLLGREFFMAAWVMVLIHQLSRCPSIKPPRVSSLKMERAQPEIPFGLLGTICGRLSCNSGLRGEGVEGPD